MTLSHALTQLGSTAISGAAEAGHLSISKMLMDAGANTNHNSNVRESLFEYTFTLI